MAEDGIQRTGLSEETGTLEERIENLENTITEEEGKRDDLLSQCESVRNIKEESGKSAQKVIENIQGEIKEQDSKMLVSAPEITPLQEGIEENIRQKAILETEISQLKADLEEARKTKESNTDTISSLKKEDQIRTNKIDNKKAAIAPLPGQIQVVDEKTAALEQKIADYRASHVGMKTADPAAI